MQIAKPNVCYEKRNDQNKQILFLKVISGTTEDRIECTYFILCSIAVVDTRTFVCIVIV